MKFFKVTAAFILMWIAVPAIAQENPANTVSFNDFSFSFDAGLATHVSITHYLSEPTDVFPPQGEHTHFIIYGEDPPDASIVGIRVYRIDDLAAHEHTQQQVTQLQALLTERRDLTQLVNSTLPPLPFLPVQAALQTIHARAQYVGTPAVTGISYITAYQQVAEPLLQDIFLYTFQGISTDGVHYVSAAFRVNPESFPTEMPADFDYQAFPDQLPDYLTESAAQLNTAPVDTFTPSLDLLDAVIESFAFES